MLLLSQEGPHRPRTHGQLSGLRAHPREHKQGSSTAPQALLSRQMEQKSFLQAFPSAFPAASLQRLQLLWVSGCWRFHAERSERGARGSPAEPGTLLERAPGSASPAAALAQQGGRAVVLTSSLLCTTQRSGQALLHLRSGSGRSLRASHRWT